MQDNEDEMKCPECGSTSLAKHGKFRDGRQLYVCKLCGRYFVEKPRRLFKYGRGQLDEIKQLSIKMVRMGMSYYGVAKRFDLTVNTVRRWCIEAGVKSRYSRRHDRGKYEWKTEALNGITYMKTMKYDILLFMSTEISTALDYIKKINMYDKIIGKFHRYIDDPSILNWIGRWVMNEILKYIRTLEERLRLIDQELKKHIRIVSW